MSSVYGNAPFACVLPNGRIAYTQNSSQKIRAFVADVNGKNSVEMPRPFSNDYNTFYSCITPISDNMVLITAHDYTDCSKIHLNRGRIAKDTLAPTAPGIPTISAIEGNKYTLNWTKSTDNYIVSHYEVWNDNELLARTRWDNFITIDIQHMSQYNIKVRAQDYQGNYSPFSETLVFTASLSNPTDKTLKVHPTVVPDKIQIQHNNLTDKTLHITSILGKTVVKQIASDGVVNLAELNPGIYLLSLKDGKQTYTTKIIKK